MMNTAMKVFKPKWAITYIVGLSEVKYTTADTDYDLAKKLADLNKRKLYLRKVVNQHES